MHDTTKLYKLLVNSAVNYTVVRCGRQITEKKEQKLKNDNFKTFSRIYMIRQDKKH
jgi:hypothetical protein